MVRGYYRQVFGPVLQKRFDSFVGSGDMLDLYDELALLRSTAMDAVSIYSAAIESADPAAALQAGQFVSAAMQNVAKMVESIAKLEVMRGNIITKDALNVIARQITQASFEAFGDSDPRVQVFLSSLENIIEDPTAVKRVSPDRLLEMMVGTVEGPPSTQVLNEVVDSSVNPVGGNGNGNGTGQNVSEGPSLPGSGPIRPGGNGNGNGKGNGEAFLP